MPFSTITLLYVAAGGAFGAMFRFYLVKYFSQFFVHPLFSPISFINIIGCFMAGCLYPFLLNQTPSPLLKNAILIGFLGAFTTFSSFMLEALEISLNTKIFFTFLQIALCNLLSFLSCFLGFFLAKTLQDYMLKFLS